MNFHLMIQVWSSALGLHTSNITCTYTRYVSYPDLSASQASVASQDLHKPSPNHPSVRQQRLWVRIFSREDKITSLAAQPCICQHKLLTVKVGLPEEFCTLRLNCMHLPYFCGALMLKAGASPLSSFAADFPHNAVSFTLHQWACTKDNEVWLV